MRKEEFNKILEVNFKERRRKFFKIISNRDLDIILDIILDYMENSKSFSRKNLIKDRSLKEIENLVYLVSNKDFIRVKRIVEEEKRINKEMRK
jgi:hypothetical protein